MGEEAADIGDLLPPGHAPVGETVALPPMQRMAAAHLLKSQEITAPVTIMGEADAQGLVDLREELTPQDSVTDGQHISLTHLIIARVASALRRHPKLNAARTGNSLQIYGQINIAIALALPDGNLIVPVIKDADTLTIGQIADAVADLRQRGEAGKLGLDDVRGATFTVTNAGMVPCTRWTTPIIPIGQTAILGVGSVRRVPVVKDDAVVPGWVLPLSLTFDHCAINGYPASEFLEDLAAFIANPKRPAASKNSQQAKSDQSTRGQA